jgi:RNA-binding protein 25
MRARLDIWDDNESDELFYTDCVCWCTQCAQRLSAEEAADNKMRTFEACEAENLCRESEAFLVYETREHGRRTVWCTALTPRGSQSGLLGSCYVM